MGTIEHHTKPPGVDSGDGKVSKTAWGEGHDFTLAPADITGLDAALTGKAAAAHSHAGEDITSGTVADARVAAAIARDTEVTAAVSAHESAGDPHPGYLTPAEGNAAYDASGAAAAVAGAAAAADAAHEADTTAIHGIADTSALYRVGGTDVAVADGGTGASTAANARTNLGLVIATDVEAHDADLTTIAGLAPSNDDVLQRKAGAWANRSIAQLLVDLAAPGTTFQPLDSDLTAIAALATTAYGRALLALADAAALRVAGGLVIGTDVRAQGTGDPTRASLGLDTTDSPQFAGLNVGAATDTTLTRTGAGDVAVEGNALYRAGGTDVPVADGGTGASTAAAAATNLGLGTGDSPQFTGVNVGNASDTTISRSGAGDIAVEGNAIYRAGGTDVPVADGGTGSSTASGARTNLGYVAPVLNRLTSGDVTVTATTNVFASNVAGLGDITLAAVTGDYIEVGLSAIAPNTTANSMKFDVCSVVAGAAVNFVSNGTGTGSTNGVSGWYITLSVIGKAGGSLLYVAQAGDLSGGNIVLRLTCFVSGSRVLGATANQPVTFWARNLRQ